MRLIDLWKVTADSFIFIKNADGTHTEYNGTKDMQDRIISNITATKYPMYDKVLEVTLV